MKVKTNSANGSNSAPSLSHHHACISHLSTTPTEKHSNTNTNTNPKRAPTSKVFKTHHRNSIPKTKTTAFSHKNMHPKDSFPPNPCPPRLYKSSSRPHHISQLLVPRGSLYHTRFKLFPPVLFSNPKPIGFSLQHYD